MRNASIDYLTEKASLPVLNSLPQIKRVIVYERKESFLQLVKTIRKEKYDMVFDFYSNPRSAQLTLLSGARYRIGFPYRGRKYAYNLYAPSERGKYHSADLHLKFLELLNIPIVSNELLFVLKDSAIDTAEKIIKSFSLIEKKFAIIIPGGGWNSKRCDPEKFIEIGNEVFKEFKTNFLILWGPDDKHEAEKIHAGLSNISFLAPPTSIQEMAAIIKRALFTISNDSGPMHISAAVKTPTLGLFGPTDPKLQGPYGENHNYVQLENLKCIKCNLLNCPLNHECFFQIPVESVILKLKIMLANISKD